MPFQTKYIFSAAMDVQSYREALFNEVYDKEHVPLLLKVPGVVAVARFKKQEVTLVIGGERSDLGLLAYLRGDTPAARSHLERSLEHFRAAGNHSGIEMSLNRLGDVARCENDFPEAERLYTECMAVYSESGDVDEIASLLHNLGYVISASGDLARALRLFRAALSMQQELDNQAGMAECIAGIASVLARQGHSERAARLFGASDAMREAAGVVLWPANLLEYERSLALLRDSMKEEELSAARAEGRTQPVGKSLREAYGTNGRGNYQ